MQRHKFAILWVVLLSCGVYAVSIESPRLRPSPYFGSFTGVSFASVEELGQHNYNSFFGENNALMYTAGAGYIDMGHLRESADRARYLFEICYDNIRNGNTEFSFQAVEPAQYFVSLVYPSDWDSMDAYDKDLTARDAAIDLGQHFAHLSTIWHEIVTWYGYASTGLLSEKASSFSWEDGYSDLLGTKLAARVLRENRLDYNEGMTEIIVREIERLHPQPVKTAEEATALIKGKWYTGRYPFLKMKRRNFDVGFDDGYITPFRVPGVADEVGAVPCRVPTLDALAKSGITMRLTLEPKESERHQVLRIIYPAGGGTTLEPMKDFPVIIEHIHSEAIADDGIEVDQPVL